MKELRFKNIDFIYDGWPTIYKPGRLMPLKLSYNGTAGWWLSRNVFMSANQLKELLKTINYVSTRI